MYGYIIGHNVQEVTSNWCQFPCKWCHVGSARRQNHVAGGTRTREDCGRRCFLVTPLESLDPTGPNLRKEDEQDWKRWFFAV